MGSNRFIAGKTARWFYKAFDVDKDRLA